MRCPAAISRKDPISLANEIHKVLDNTGSDWPFHVIFSGNDRWANGFQLMQEPAFDHAPNSRDLALKVKRVWSKMNTYPIFDHKILQWLTVALYLPSVSSNGQQISVL